ncbi:porin [Paraburkholderia heleia]|uniref:porin n=1 Tax=Paraburkholderia heleia TaxID=634127 RepID=UPI002AB6F2E1|nr:porin [Paraburkholderia heleia]
MKINGVAVIVMLLPGVAVAQSSVTLYGEIDTGISYINNARGASVVKMRSGAWDGSRWGLIGSEDLGSGYHAIFKLENGFDSTSGSLGNGGRLFGRQSYVGLDSPYGTLTFGRQYDTIVDNLGPILSNGRASSPIYDLDNAGNDWATDNMIKFKSQRYYGLSGSVMYVFGGLAGHMSTNSAFGGGLNYSNGPLQAGVNYTSIRNPYHVWWNDTGASNIATFGSVLPTARSLDIAAMGASYNVGKFTARAGMTHSAFTDSINGSHSQFNTYEIQGDYMLRQDFRVAATAEFTEASLGLLAEHPKYRQYNLLADYILSKRTDIYGWLIYGTAAGGATQAQIGQLTASSTTRQVNVQVGMRHRF